MQEMQKMQKILHHGLVVTLHARYVSTLHINMEEVFFSYHAYRPARESAFISFHDMFLFKSNKSFSLS